MKNYSILESKHQEITEVSQNKETKKEIIVDDKITINPKEFNKDLIMLVNDEKLSENYLAEEVKEVIEEVNNFEIDADHEEVVRKMLSLY